MGTKTISIFCQGCKSQLFKYAKQGNGSLVKIRKHKILQDFTTNDGVCPTCCQEFGRPFLHQGKPPSHKVLQAAGIKNYWRIRKSVHSNMNSHSELHHRSSSGAIQDISHAQLSDSKGPPPALDEKKVRPPPPKCKPLPPTGKAKPHKSPKLIRELPGDDAKLDGALAILKHTRQLRSYRKGHRGRRPAVSVSLDTQEYMDAMTAALADQGLE